MLLCCLLLQYNAFIVLFLHALRPGGIYFIEDLSSGRYLVDGDKKHIIQVTEVMG